MDSNPLLRKVVGKLKIDQLQNNNSNNNNKKKKERERKRFGYIFTPNKRWNRKIVTCIC